MCGCEKNKKKISELIASGSAGLAKAAVASTIGHDRCNGHVREARLTICREQCDRYDSKWGKCQECGCLLGPKTIIASEQCPLGKW